MRSIMPSWPITQRPVLLGSTLAGLAAVCYGTSQFLGRKLVTEQAPPLVVATFSLLAGALILTAISHRGVIQDRHAPRRAFILMALAGVASSAGAAFNLLSLNLAPVVIASPVSATSPLISLTLAHFFLRRIERVTPRIWLGAALVVIGVILITLGSA
ncbi:MAG: DMT family transporter [Dehalococcoidia bacterium]